MGRSSITIALALSQGHTVAAHMAAGRPVPPDLARAQSQTPSHALSGKGKGPAEVRSVLNGAMEDRHPSVFKACEEFEQTKLDEIASSLEAMASPVMQSIYDKHDDLRSLPVERVRKLRAVEGHDEGHVRDASCAAIATLWSHHLTSAMQEEAKALLHALPLLPSAEREEPHLEDTTQYTCVTGHAGVVGGSDSVGNDNFPDSTLEWPAEVQWNGTGHGPYPFWAGPVTADIDDGAAIQSWWSAKQDSERLDHASCAMSVVGHEDDVPCTHLFVDKNAYYFSQDEEFCCISGTDSLQQSLTAPQTTWMADFTYQGTVDNFETEYYSGTAHNYTLDCSGTAGCGPGNFYIWYLVDTEYRPIEQGEGCQVMPRTSQCASGGSYLYHNYDPATFVSTEIDSGVFAVPEVCQTTTNECYFP